MDLESAKRSVQELGLRIGEPTGQELPLYLGDARVGKIYPAAWVAPDEYLLEISLPEGVKLPGLKR